MVLPTLNEEYGSLDYWNDRYGSLEQDEEAFEWFKGFKDLSSMFAECMADKSGNILHLGSGNSLLSEDLYEAGWSNVVNVDYSPVVIDKMKSKFSHPTVKWIVADIFQLDAAFPAQSFMYAIDKGTLDALLTAKYDQWNPPAELCSRIQVYMDQVARVLKPGGLFIHITFAQPHFRRQFLESAGCFDVQVKILSDSSSSFEYFAYFCTRKA